MQFDLASLQLVVNIVMITAVASLAVICDLLRRDNQKLTLELSLQLEQAAATTREIPHAQWTPDLVGNLLPESESVAVLHALPVIHPDIRQFVSRRAQDWTIPSAVDPGSKRTPVGCGLYS